MISVIMPVLTVLTWNPMGPMEVCELHGRVGAWKLLSSLGNLRRKLLEPTGLMVAFELIGVGFSELVRK